MTRGCTRLLHGRIFSQRKPTDHLVNASLLILTSPQAPPTRRSSRQRKPTDFHLTPSLAAHRRLPSHPPPAHPPPQLATSGSANVLELLKIFAYGTWKDYAGAPFIDLFNKFIAPAMIPPAYVKHALEFLLSRPEYRV